MNLVYTLKLLWYSLKCIYENMFWWTLLSANFEIVYCSIFSAMGRLLFARSEQYLRKIEYNILCRTWKICNRNLFIAWYGELYFSSIHVKLSHERSKNLNRKKFESTFAVNTRRILTTAQTFWRECILERMLTRESDIIDSVKGGKLQTLSLVQLFSGYTSYIVIDFCYKIKWRGL